MEPVLLDNSHRSAKSVDNYVRNRRAFSLSAPARADGVGLNNRWA
jgi:hypothetical protein